MESEDRSFGVESGGHTRIIANEALDWLASTSPSAALTDPYIEHELFPPEDRLRQDVAQALLQNIPPLRGMNISGVPDPDRLRAILSQHGPSMQQLHFRSAQEGIPSPSDTQNKLEAIVDLYPALAHLIFHLVRTEGDHREVALYRLFGTLKHLTCLNLTFDTCSSDSGRISESEGAA